MFKKRLAKLVMLQFFPLGIDRYIEKFQENKTTFTGEKTIFAGNQEVAIGIWELKK